MQEATIDIMPALEAAGQVQIDGALGVSLHNAGTATVTIDGHFTLQPGATFQIAAPVPQVVISTALSVKFGAAGTKRLEIATIRLKGRPFSNLNA